MYTDLPKSIKCLDWFFFFTWWILTYALHDTGCLHSWGCDQLLGDTPSPRPQKPRPGQQVARPAQWPLLIWFYAALQALAATRILYPFHAVGKTAMRKARKSKNWWWRRGIVLHLKPRSRFAIFNRPNYQHETLKEAPVESVGKGGGCTGDALTVFKDVIGKIDLVQL